jgi:hypothetical protein
MITTILLSVLLMAGLFLMLLAAVGFIQDRRLFTSAPKDVQAVIQPREERFPGAHAVGWIMMAFALAMMGGAFALGGVDGIRNGFAFRQFFVRFLTMLLLLKAYDILFFDLYLLCHSGFFPYFYPETKDLVGPRQFGFNWKSHMIQIVLCPLASALFAWICMFF